jgi:hypothetical protein
VAAFEPRSADRQSTAEVSKDRIQASCRKWRVKELAIFGSALREGFGSDSGVDLLVELEGDHGVSRYDWVDMIDELKGIFGRNVDLVAKDALKSPLPTERDSPDGRGHLCILISGTPPAPCKGDVGSKATFGQARQGA